MTTLCPNGHDSQWPDWCSTCGERIAGEAAGAGGTASNATGAAGGAAGTTAPKAEADPSKPLVETPPPATGPTCDNCGVARHEHDVFCESCGYDFASGSLPDQEAGDAAAAATQLAPVHVKVSVDAEFFAASVGDVELTLPDPMPDTQVIPLPGNRVLIGRQSNSRGVYPEVDVRALTDDPAVSTQHALLERDTDGNWTLTDLGSTNGTFLTGAADEELESGVVLPVEVGTAFYLGAWTRIELAKS